MDASGYHPIKKRTPSTLKDFIAEEFVKNGWLVQDWKVYQEQYGQFKLPGGKILKGFMCSFPEASLGKV
jgi:hypothetical protein